MRTKLRDDRTYKAKVWDYLLEAGICTEDELQLVTNIIIRGYNEETMDDILFAKTGYRSLEQLLDCDIER